MTKQFTTRNQREKIKGKRLLAMTAAILMAACTSGCGGGSSHHSSSSSGNNSADVQGVATPSNLSVVTAQNADAGS